jgi:hypothetical protein
MGMVGCFTSVSEETLARLRADEDLIEEFLYPDDGESEPENYIDLDKAWHGLHYLLTGEADGGKLPLSLAVIGGEEFGPEVGYGPARFLSAIQVAQVAKALESITVESLSAKFDPQDMERKQIYPDVIWGRDGAEALDYLLENYEQLEVFYRDAAARGDAVIQWLS